MDGKAALIMARPQKTLEEYFWLRVKKGTPDECWLWTGARDTFGYGRVQLGRNSKRITASRTSWIIHNGPLESSKILVCHKCDNPPCCNPNHLFVGTHLDNIRDAARKGRMSVPGKGWERNKTHCKHGHPFSEKNTYKYGNHRICRPCRARVERERRADGRA